MLSAGDTTKATQICSVNMIVRVSACIRKRGCSDMGGAEDAGLAISGRIHH